MLAQARRALVAPHQAGVANNVGSKDRRQFALLTGQWSFPALLQRIVVGLECSGNLMDCPGLASRPTSSVLPFSVGCACAMLSLAGSGAGPHVDTAGNVAEQVEPRSSHG